jgi:hypothetical protein
VQGDSVTQVAHDVVAVGPQTDDNGSTSKRPKIDLAMLLGLRVDTHRIQYGTGLLDLRLLVDQT